MRSTSWGFASRPRDLDLRIGEVPQEERRQGRVSRHPGLALPVDVWANESVVRKQFGALSGLRSFGGVGDRGAGHVFEAGTRGSIRDGNDLHAGNEVRILQRRIQIESSRHGDGGGTTASHGRRRRSLFMGFAARPLASLSPRKSRAARGRSFLLRHLAGLEVQDKAFAPLVGDQENVILPDEGCDENPLHVALHERFDEDAVYALAPKFLA